MSLDYDTSGAMIPPTARGSRVTAISIFQRFGQKRISHFTAAQLLAVLVTMLIDDRAALLTDYNLVFIQDKQRKSLRVKDKCRSVEPERHFRVKHRGTRVGARSA